MPKPTSLFKRKRRNAKPEQLLQTAAFNYLRPLMAAQKRQHFMAFQIRNETGVAGKVVKDGKVIHKGQGHILGAIAKQMGTMSGVADSLFLFPGRNPFNEKAESFYPPAAAFVEFKAYTPPKTMPDKKPDVDKLMSEDQITFRASVEALGFRYIVIAAKDANDVVNQIQALLREYGVPGV